MQLRSIEFACKKFFLSEQKSGSDELLHKTPKWFRTFHSEFDVEYATEILEWTKTCAPRHLCNTFSAFLAFKANPGKTTENTSKKA